MAENIPTPPRLPTPLPQNVNAGTHVFTSGPFAGMTFEQAVQYYYSLQNQVQEAQERFGPKPKEEGPSLAQGAGVLAGSIGGLAGANYIKNAIAGTAKPAATTAATLATAPGAASTGGAVVGGSSLPAVPGAAGGAAPIAGGGVPLAAPSFELGGAVGGVPAPAAGAAAPGAAPAAGGGGYGLLGLNAAPGTVGGAFLPAAGLAAGAYTGYESIRGIADALKGEEMSLPSQAALALPTFGASFLYNPIREAFGSGKDKNQRADEDLLGALMERNPSFVDREHDYGVRLADGSYFSLGGQSYHAPYTGSEVGPSVSDRTPGGRAYNLDYNAPGIGEDIGALQPLAIALAGVDPGTTEGSRFVGRLVNAARSGGDKAANINQLYANTGMTRDQIYGLVNEAATRGIVNEGTRDAAFAAIDRQFGVVNPNAPRDGGSRGTNAAPTSTGNWKAGAVTGSKVKPKGVSLSNYKR